MSFALVTTHHFERRARKFLRKHPDLRPVLRDTLDDLSRDPLQPQLKPHPLGGPLSGMQADAYRAAMEDILGCSAGVGEAYSALRIERRSLDRFATPESNETSK